MQHHPADLQRQLSISGLCYGPQYSYFLLPLACHASFTFTKAQLLTLRGTDSKFINDRIFSSLSFDAIQLHRCKDSLGILDPIKQQNSLQWRWVHPLRLFNHHVRNSDSSLTSLPVLRYIFDWFTYLHNSQHICLLLFLPFVAFHLRYLMVQLIIYNFWTFSLISFARLIRYLDLLIVVI